jgi:hypothetical protein
VEIYPRLSRIKGERKGEEAKKRRRKRSAREQEGKEYYNFSANT